MALTGTQLMEICLAFVLFLNTFQASLGLKCYACRSMNGQGHEGCEQNPPPSRYLTECNQPECWKRYAYAHGRSYVERYCISWPTGRSSCEPTIVTDEMTGESFPGYTCTCSTDGCNSAPTFKSNFGSPLVAFVVLGIINHFVAEDHLV